MLTVEKKGSDLHLNVGAPPCIRIHGEMEPQEFPVLTRDDVHNMLYDIMTDIQKSRFEEHHDLDFSVELGSVGRFRVNVLMTRRGEGAVFRVIPTKIKSMEELDVKRYGVIVSSGHKRGLLLPNLEGIDTPNQQVSIAKKKAGIYDNEKFTMERFEVVRHK
jgi:twitching motility protein PilT